MQELDCPASELPPLPAWCQPQTTPTATILRGQPKDYTELFKGVSEGQRNATAASITGRYYAAGFAASEILQALKNWNDKNVPPMEERELQTIVTSIGRRELLKTANHVVSGDSISDSDKCEQLAMISERFGIIIDDIRIIEGSEPKYEFSVNGKTARLLAEDMITQHQWRKKICAAARIVPKSVEGKNEKWRDWANRMMAIAKEVDSGPEATEAGELKGWLNSYLERHKPEEQPIQKTWPLKVDGVCFLHTPTFIRYVRNSFDIKQLKAREFSQNLASHQFKPTTKWVTTKDGKRHSIRMYSIPPGMIDE
jgi:hypothetical protein